MKILITGASGFLGKNLLEYIEETKVIPRKDLILLTSRIIPGYTCILHKNYTFTKDDFVQKGITEIDAVIHAGFSVPKTNTERYSDETESYLNIRNTYHLISNLPVIPKKFVLISSVSIYGIVSGTISEKSPANPTTSYGCSKLYCEMMVTDWAERLNVNLQILRCGQMYGKYSKANSLIESTINKVINDEVPEIWSDGNDARSYMYVKNCCNVIIQAVKKEERIKPAIIAGPETITILELMNLIIKISGKKLFPKILNKNTGGRNYQYDTTLLKKEYKTNDFISIHQGLTETYNYSLTNQKNEKK